MYSKRLHPKKGLCLAALLCFNTHTMPAHSLPGQETTGHSTVDTTFTAPNDWAVTAIPFKLYGERQVNHVKINWQPLKGIQYYKLYRNGQLIGETQRTKLTLTGWMLIENIKKQPVPQHKKPAPLLIPARRLCTTTETAGTSEPHRTNRRDLKSARLTSPTGYTGLTRT